MMNNSGKVTQPDELLSTNIIQKAFRQSSVALSHGLHIAVQRQTAIYKEVSQLICALPGGHVGLSGPPCVNKASSNPTQPPCIEVHTTPHKHCTQSTKMPEERLIDEQTQ